MNTQYYTVSEVATLLNVSARTVSRMIKNGELPANRVGGAVRIAPADLSVYLNASKIEPTKKKRHWKSLGVSAQKLAAQTYFRDKYGEHRPANLRAMKKAAAHEAAGREV